MKNKNKQFNQKWVVIISVIGVFAVVIGITLSIKWQKDIQEAQRIEANEMRWQWKALGFGGEPLYDENGKFDLSYLDEGDFWMRVQVYNQVMGEDVTSDQVISSALKEEGSNPEIIDRFAAFYSDIIGAGGVNDNTEKLSDYKGLLMNVHLSSTDFQNDHPDLAAIDFNDLTPEQLEILAEYIEE